MMALVYMGTILAIMVWPSGDVQRFTGNLLGREGYLMVPVSPAS